MSLFSFRDLRRFSVNVYFYIMVSFLKANQISYRPLDQNNTVGCQVRWYKKSQAKMIYLASTNNILSLMLPAVFNLLINQYMRLNQISFWPRGNKVLAKFCNIKMSHENKLKWYWTEELIPLHLHSDRAKAAIDFCAERHHWPAYPGMKTEALRGE